MTLWHFFIKKLVLYIFKLMIYRHFDSQKALAHDLKTPYQDHKSIEFMNRKQMKN